MARKSAWARGARWCRRWRSATARRDGVRRGASSTSFARRRAGIASMRCARLGDTGRGSRPGRRNGPRRRKYDATIKDAVTALWEASDRVCGKRLVVMIPALAPALERHGRLKLDAGDHDRVLAISAATIDRCSADVRSRRAAASGDAQASIRQSGARFRSGRSMTGKARRRASARSTWSHMAARRWRARSSRR